MSDGSQGNGTTPGRNQAGRRPETWKELFLQLFGSEEVVYVVVGVSVALLILLIIACCMGCKACCCRACCCARETRASVYMCKVPKRGGEKKDIALLPISRCCYHPAHCYVDVERPACHCRRICTACNQYLPIPRACGGEVPVELEPSAKNLYVPLAEKATNTGVNIVDVDPPYQAPKGKKRRPPPPPKPDVGFNYRPPVNAWSYTRPTPHPNAPPASQMGMENPKQSTSYQAQNEDDDWGN